MKWNRDGKKKELWENDKTKWQIWRINLALKIMKFQRQTHGLGMLFLIMMVFFLFITALPLLTREPPSQEAIRVEKIARCLQYDTCFWSVSV